MNVARTFFLLALVIPRLCLATALTSGGSHGGVIEQGESETFTFSGSSGESILVSVAAPNELSEIEPVLSLYGPDGTLVADAWGNGGVLMRHELGKSGQFTVVLEDSSLRQLDDTGSYRLSFAKFPDVVSVPSGDEGGPVESGALYEGVIERADMDLYQFQGSPGETILVETARIDGTGDFEPTVSLYDPDGAYVLGFGFEKELQKEGRYTLVVDDEDPDNLETGSYRLSFSKFPDVATVPPEDQGGGLVSGITYEGFIEPEGDVDLYQFTGSEGESIRVTFTDGYAETGGERGSLAAELRLYDPDGSRRRIGTIKKDAYVVELEKTGRHTFAIRSNAVPPLGNPYDEGSYKLFFAKFPDAAAIPPGDEGGEVESGVVYDGFIDPYDVDIYHFTGSRGDSLDVSVDGNGEGETLLPVLSLFDPDGSWVNGILASSIERELEKTGRYSIVVEDRWSAGTGSYRLFFDLDRPVPEIEVTGNGETISDGDTSPSVADGTDFGSVDLADGSVDHTFRVSNTGGETLTLGTATSSSDEFAVSGLGASIAPGGFDEFTVTFDPITEGTKAATISFATNDADENPFDFEVSGEATAPVLPPEITVEHNGTTIQDGDTSPSVAEGTDFGSVDLADGSVDHTFRVSNTGGETLTLGTATSSSGDFRVSGLAVSIAPGGFDEFTVTFDPTTEGTKTATISFPTNDADANPFDFEVSGEGIASAPPPEIVVEHNGTTIRVGDTSPSSADGTDLGDMELGGSPLARTFRVRNTGGRPLSLGQATSSSGEFLVSGLAASIASGGFDDFTVTFDPTSAGTKTAAIRFATNDADENPFVFTVRGGAHAAGPNNFVPEFVVDGTVKVFREFPESGPAREIRETTEAVAEGDRISVSIAGEHIESDEMILKEFSLGRGEALLGGSRITVSDSSAEISFRTTAVDPVRILRRLVTLGARRRAESVEGDYRSEISGMMPTDPEEITLVRSQIASQYSVSYGDEFETVTVPAGTFAEALRVETTAVYEIRTEDLRQTPPEVTNTSRTVQWRDWYVNRVGLVKSEVISRETGNPLNPSAGIDRELISYSIPGLEGPPPTPRVGEDGELMLWEERIGVYGDLTPLEDPEWFASEFFGLAFLPENPSAHDGFVWTERFGWMKFETDSERNLFLYVPRLRTWMEVQPDGSFYSFDFRRLVPLGLNTYRSRILGTVTTGEFNGWVHSDRFGWVWAARGTGGTWFWSEDRQEWLGVTPDGGIWSTAEGRFL